jgi:hypothetical protein
VRFGRVVLAGARLASVSVSSIPIVCSSATAARFVEVARARPACHDQQPEATMARKTSGTQSGAALKSQRESGAPEHDQDSDPPRTAVPPGVPRPHFDASGSDDPLHDQDSDPPRTAVPPQQ